MGRTAHWMRETFEDVSKGATFLAADDFTTNGQDVIAAKNVNYTIFVQRIIVNIVTPVAQSLTFQDNASTPVKVGSGTWTTVPDLSERARVLLDGGAEGIPLTAGKNLDIIASAAGLEGSWYVEAYQRPTANIDATAGASLQ